MNSIQPDSKTTAQKNQNLPSSGFGPIRSHAEVAAILGITDTTSMRRERSALRKIRRYLVSRGYGASL